MKRLALILGFSVWLAACEKNGAEKPSGDRSGVDMENIVSTAEFRVPVTQGKVSVVRSATGGEIARTASPVTILVGKDDKPAVEYVDAAPGDENETRSSLWQVVLFEDSRSGDYDYNDLVIHVKYDVKGDKFGIGIQPIALGSTKKITLGCDLWQNGAYLRQGIIVAEDCRAKFFGGTDKMVNTFGVDPDFCVFDYKPYYGSNLITLKDAGKPVYVNWFIEVDGGTRFYAVSTVRTTGVLDGNKRPYGLVLTTTGYSYEQEGQGTVGRDWFNYPRESVSIEKVYPNFAKWLTGEYTGTLSSMYDPGAEGAYDAIGHGLYVVPKGNTDAFGKPSQKSHVIPLGTTQEMIDTFNW